MCERPNTPTNKPINVNLEVETTREVSKRFAADNRNTRMTLTCCGGEGGRARAAGVDRRQGWHSGADAAAGG